MTIKKTDITTAGPILVTGGFGFTGRFLIQDLINHNVPPSQIHVLARNINSPTRTKFPSVTYHEADLTSTASVTKALSTIRPTIVFHTASPRVFIHSPAEYIRSNVTGTLTILEAAQNAGTRAFVYTSSTSVMEDGVSSLRFASESDPVHALTLPLSEVPYQHSKAKAEALVLKLNDQSPSHMLTVSLRATGIFGKGDEQHFAKFVDIARRGNARFQFGGSDTLFDYCYVENMTKAHILAAEKLLAEFEAAAARSGPTATDDRGRDVKDPSPSKQSVAGEAIIITNAEPMPFWTFVRLIATELDYFDPQTTSVIVLPAWIVLMIGSIAEWSVWLFSFGTKRSFTTRRAMAYSVQDYCFSVEKARGRLGYGVPREEGGAGELVSIREGIRRAAEGCRKGDVEKKKVK